MTQLFPASSTRDKLLHGNAANPMMQEQGNHGVIIGAASGGAALLIIIIVIIVAVVFVRRRKLAKYVTNRYTFTSHLIVAGKSWESLRLYNRK